MPWLLPRSDMDRFATRANKALATGWSGLLRMGIKLTSHQHWSLVPRGPLRELNPNGEEYPALKMAATARGVSDVHWLDP